MIASLQAGPEPVTITPDELRVIPVPKATMTWQPVAHSEVLDEVEHQLSSVGAEVVKRSLIVSHGGQRFFGVLQVRRSDVQHGFNPVIGIRNSSDKAFAAGIAGGMRIICCSNLSFAGDVVFRRKHSVFIKRDLPGMVRSGIEHIEEIWDKQVRQVEAYQNTRLTNVRAHDMTIRAIDAGVISGSKVPDVVAEWRKPSHDDFKRRNVWAFFNAATEVLKKSNPFSLPTRTQKLHELCDSYCGVA